MTHKDIYEKFMIEYDKANITSSYPSLTKYEVATFLDKAYLALIAQKVTGNNPRRALFEADVKAVEDLRPLIVNESLEQVVPKHPVRQWPHLATNETMWKLPTDYLYYVDGFIVDDKGERRNVLFTDHQIALNFKVTDINYPWVKQPVCYMLGERIHVLTDPESATSSVAINFIKTPNKFVVDKKTDPQQKTYKYVYNNSVSKIVQWDFVGDVLLNTEVKEYEVLNGVETYIRSFNANYTITIDSENESDSSRSFKRSVKFNANGQMTQEITIEWEVVQQGKGEVVYRYYTDKQVANNVASDATEHTFYDIRVYRETKVNGSITEEKQYAGIINEMTVTFEQNDTAEEVTRFGTKNVEFTPTI